jgi:hypothetical protein
MENFCFLVSKCLSIDEGNGKGGLTTEMVMKFSWWARQYILAYFYIEHETKDNIKEGRLHEINIERIKIEFKTHLSAIAFDEKFMNYCFQKTESSMISDKYKY